MPSAKIQHSPDDEPTWTDEELAWCGAILSTCTMYAPDTKVLVLSKASTDVDLLEQMAEVIGGAVTGPYNGSKKHLGKKKRHRWFLGHQSVVVPLLRDCWDWLSPTARRKARKILGPKKLGLR